MKFLVGIVLSLLIIAGGVMAYSWSSNSDSSKSEQTQPGMIRGSSSSVAFESSTTKQVEAATSTKPENPALPVFEVLIAGYFITFILALGLVLSFMRRNMQGKEKHKRLNYSNK